MNIFKSKILQILVVCSFCIGIVYLHGIFKCHKIEYILTNPKGIIGHAVITGRSSKYNINTSNADNINIIYLKSDKIADDTNPKRDTLVYKISGQFCLRAYGEFNEGTAFEIRLDGKQIYRIIALMGKLDFNYEKVVLERGKNHWKNQTRKQLGKKLLVYLTGSRKTGLG